MPHQCVKCGKEYKVASLVVLKGCEICGGKKFLFVSDRPQMEMDESTEKQEINPQKGIPPEEEEDSGQVVEDGDRVESVRIVSPGTYELNIAKMAESDDRVVRIGKAGSYMVDLHSMVKARRKKQSQK
jgi:predicted  nucleic acid-binding Zn-ribbon protein